MDRDEKAEAGNKAKKAKKQGDGSGVSNKIDVGGLARACGSLILFEASPAAPQCNTRGLLRCPARYAAAVGRVLSFSLCRLPLGFPFVVFFFFCSPRHCCVLCWFVGAPAAFPLSPRASPPRPGSVPPSILVCVAGGGLRVGCVQCGPSHMRKTSINSRICAVPASAVCLAAPRTSK